MTRKAPVLEKDLQRAVIDLAERLGWRVMHIHDSRREVRPGMCVGDREVRGWPDLTLVHPGKGRIMWRELKSSTGTLTDAQRGWLHDLRCCGMDAGVWTTDDWPVRISAELQGASHG